MAEDIDARLLEALGIEEIAEPGESPALAPDPTCGVCGDRIQGAEVRCPECEAPHHAECWEYNEGCSIYGCQGVLAEVRRRGQTLPALQEPEPQVQELSPPTGELAAVQRRLASLPPSTWHLTGFLLLVLSFVFAAADLRDRGYPGLGAGLTFALGNIFFWLGAMIQEILLWSVNRDRPRRLFSLGDTSTKDLQARLVRDPKDLEALTALALVHFARRDWKQAAHFYEQALTLAPEQPELLFRYAKTLDQLGRQEEVRELFTRLVRDHGEHSAARNARYWLERLSRLEKYRAELRERRLAAGLDTRPQSG